MIRLPGYSITQKIYEGQRAIVFRGWRLVDSKPVVIKGLNAAHPSAAEIADFKREYAMMRRFNSPGIIKAYSLELYKDSMVIVMEDFNGQSLKNLLLSRTCLPLPDFFEVAIQISSILGEVHAKDMMHRDINPANVLVSPHDWSVKLIDFGLALRYLADQPQIPIANIMEGTPAYISPEQTGRINQPLDYRTDFYALGVTFYEMLLGRLPFTATDEVEMVHAHLAKLPPVPHELNPEIPPCLSDIIMKLLEKDAANRYQTAQEIHFALQNCVRNLPIKLTVDRFDLDKTYIDEPRPANLAPPVDTRQTDINHLEPAPAPTDNLDSTRRRTSDELDFTSLAKALQLISSEMRLDDLLRHLMQIVMTSSGAERGVLVLDENGQWLMVAESTASAGKTTLLPPTPLSPTPPQKLPVSILNQVARTQQSLVLGDIDFTQSVILDPYIIAQKPKAILCLPLLSQGKLIGMVYLENSLTSGAFTSDRLTLLELLADQAATSIENVRLYAALADYNRTLEQQVTTRTHEGLIEVRQKLAKAQAEFEWWRAMLIEYLPHPIYVKHQDQRFFMANQPAATLRGVQTPDDLINKRDDQFFPPEMVAQYLADEAEVLAHGEPLLDYEERLVDQTTHKERWFSTVKIPIAKDGQIIGVLGVSQDITHRKHIEQRLRDSVETVQDTLFINNFVGQFIEKKVQERTEQLSKTLEYLQAVQEEMIETEKMAALGSLVAGIAHEINTPLGISVTAASGLQDKTEQLRRIYEEGKLTRGEMAKYLQKSNQLSDMILANLNRAAELVGSFKQVAVDQSNEDRRSFRLKDYLNELLLSLNPELKRTNIRIQLQVDEGLILDSYPGVFAQIVTNLIMNSLRHAYDPHDSGVITISIKQLENNLHFEYADDGHGISSENLGKIFEPFFTTKRGQGGSGLGLPIIYNLITQKLYGTIRCESEVGYGTRFLIECPLRPIITEETP